MLSAAALFGFCLVVAPLVMTPGASWTLVSASGMSGDRRGAWAAIVGTALGILTHAVLAGVGLAAVVMASAEVYRGVRLAGALCLVGLGLGLVWRSLRHGHGSTPGEVDAASRRPGVGSQVGRAYLANVLNVKAASVYLTLAPQFIPVESVGVGSMVALASVHILVMGSWLGAWSMGLGWLTGRFDVRRWESGVDAVGGVALVGLGGRALLEAR